MVSQSKATDPELLQAMDFLLDNPNPKIMEALFIKRYLPLFVNHEKSNLDQRYHVDAMGFWLAIAKSPYAEVDIIAKNEQGQEFVRFTIPPIWDNKQELLHKHPEFSITEEIRTATEKANVIEIQGFKHLHDNVMPMLKRAVPNKEYLDRWNAILNFYQQPGITDDAVVQVAAKEEAKMTRDEDFEFDDL